MSRIKISPKSKVALVSGSNRGIGKAITIELLQRGAKKVYVGARNLDTLKELKAKYGERLVPIALDVTDNTSIEKVAQTAIDLEILINNAGVFEAGGFFAEETYTSLKKNLDVNVWGLIKLSHDLIDSLKNKKEAAIVNIASVAGLANMPMAATYSATKATVHSIIQGMRAELIDENILVMGVYPGPIDTDMTKDFPMEKDTPQHVATEIIDGLIEGKEYVFPDEMSKQIEPAYYSDPIAVEKQFSQFIASTLE